MIVSMLLTVLNRVTYCLSRESTTYMVYGRHVWMTQGASTCVCKGDVFQRPAKDLGAVTPWGNAGSQQVMDHGAG